MGANLFLDVLLVLIILLFLPIGFWRGAAREAIVAGGILLGAAIANEWAGSWGGWLAAHSDLRLGAARFLSAAVALLLATVLVGYGGGAALRPPAPGRGARLIGGALAVLNGAMLLGFALTFIDAYLLERQSAGVIDDGIVARFLLRQFGWVLLVGAVVVLACIAAVTVYNALAEQPTYAAGTYGADPNTAGPGAGRPRPPRLPRAADDGKFEPATAGFDPVSGRYGADAPRADARSTLPLVGTGREPASWPEGLRSPHHDRAGERFEADLADGTNGSGAGGFAADAWLRSPWAASWQTRYAAPDGEGGSRRDGTSGDSAAHEGASDPPPAPPAGRRSGTSASGGRAHASDRCIVCGTAIGRDDVFCPLCGAQV